MTNYMIKRGRDPRKGFEKGLKRVQDKLLDVAGPLTQALVITDGAIAQVSAPDPLILWDWLQRCICLLGNANSALSAERRHTVLLRFDPQLMDMAEQEGIQMLKASCSDAPS